MSAPSERLNADTAAPDMRAHRLASEMVNRLKIERALGTPSFYNIAREVLIEEFAATLIDGSLRSEES